ncbi:unnamed protein product [Soboliphyme baturini]|uniref:Uncharacterized protein n=1 Tax=Soboliphyme baturini TaxID=241478 RepID=A0A183IZ07_9BILA|nr:unnamed protein product [Soboliphyme baturini]
MTVEEEGEKARKNRSVTRAGEKRRAKSGDGPMHLLPTYRPAVPSSIRRRLRRTPRPLQPVVCRSPEALLHLVALFGSETFSLIDDDSTTRNSRLA